MTPRLPAHIRATRRLSRVPSCHDGFRHAAGFTMLELLVSMVIVLLGVLGLAGLIVRSNQAELESYQRTQALMIAQDMADRMNSNRRVLTCYSNDATGRQLGTGHTWAAPGCAAGTNLQNNQADLDLAAWHSQLLGSAEVLSGTNIGAMIGARGCITQIDAANRIYMISVAWQGLVSTATSGNTCGQGQYGDENLRRVVTVQIRIGDLL